MSPDNEMLGLLISLVALWHLVGFAFGLVYVRLSLLSLIRQIPYEPKWKGILRGADVHLWLSGFTLMFLGMMQKGVDVYLSNPKLWTKLSVVLVWMAATQLMRHLGVPQLKHGNASPMLQLSAVSISCWLYGAFLGCAKPLGYGVVSYGEFLAGFGCVMIVTLLVVNRFIKPAYAN